MSLCARSESSTRKAMLPREVVEELLGGSGSTGLHVLVALPDALDRFLIVLALSFEIVGKDFVKGVRGGLATPSRQVLELRQPLRFHGHHFHLPRVSHDFVGRQAPACW